ncbi:HERC1 [Symbiodinium pilosum]|uniref:HERC1 protein n=1 Tax=Symbiodinium pilosum TaxID=2952 RepID=A0A812IVX0_SYMPI|nr:HERC1 [Symbiodinium pilosum]
MPSLADVVLAQEEPDLEDEALNAELASLAALRAQRQQREREARPPSARGTLPHEAQPQSEATQVRFSGVNADALLSRAEQAENAVDKEIEAMDRELQRQVAEFRKQQRRDSQPSCEEEGASLTDPAPFPPDILDSIDSAELRELKDLAAKMDEAFPDEGAPYPPAAVDGFEVPEAESEDTEVTEFKKLLDQLDVRLRALQGKEALKLPLDEAPESFIPKAVTDTLQELRSQNQYLRKSLESERRKGKLDLDSTLLEK